MFTVDAEGDDSAFYTWEFLHLIFVIKIILIVVYSLFTTLFDHLSFNLERTNCWQEDKLTLCTSVLVRTYVSSRNSHLILKNVLLHTLNDDLIQNSSSHFGTRSRLVFYRT